MFGARVIFDISSWTRSPTWGAGSSKRRRFWRARVSTADWVVPSSTTRPSVSRTTSSRWRSNEWDCSVRPRPISTTSSNSRPTPSFVYYLPATPHKQKCLNAPRLVKFHSSERTICCCFHEKLFCYFASKFCSKYVKHPLENGVNLSKDGSNFFLNIYY